MRVVAAAIGSARDPAAWSAALDAARSDTLVEVENAFDVRHDVVIRAPYRGTRGSWCDVYADSRTTMATVLEIAKRIARSSHRETWLRLVAVDGDLDGRCVLLLRDWLIDASGTTSPVPTTIAGPSYRSRPEEARDEAHRILCEMIDDRAVEVPQRDGGGRAFRLIG